MPHAYAPARNDFSAANPKTFEMLVVNSNPADTRLITEAFKEAGLTSGLRCVTDGDEALMYVRGEGRYAGVPIPDVIFLDLALPRVSGLQVLKAIKSTPELLHIPIVVASGSDDPEVVRAVYALNGNCFIRKPGDLAQFLKFVQSCYEFWGTVVTLSPKSPQGHGRRNCGPQNPISTDMQDRVHSTCGTKAP